MASVWLREIKRLGKRIYSEKEFLIIANGRQYHKISAPSIGPSSKLFMPIKLYLSNMDCMPDGVQMYYNKKEVYIVFD